MITGPARGDSEATDVLPILHVDMDAFYVEVERQRDPSLVGLPVIVGGSGRRGVVASASYEARASGVHAAMPTARARRLCPEAVVVTSDFSGYITASQAIAEVFESVTPLVEPIALDEAFLDVSGAHRLFGSSGDIAWHIRREVRNATGLDCSVGVASTKTLAKLASVAAKPSPTPQGPRRGLGVRVVSVLEEIEFLWSHPVQALWGVGPVTLKRLTGIGISTVGDLARAPVDTVVAAIGAAHGAHLASLASGRDDRPVYRGGMPKSIGHEETFETDLFDESRIRSELVRLADGVATRLRASGLVASTVTLKVRYPNFEMRTRSETLPLPIRTGGSIANLAHRLLSRVDVSSGVRLVGISVSGLDKIADVLSEHDGAAARVPSAREAALDAAAPQGVEVLQLALDLGPPATPERLPERAAPVGSATADSETDRQIAEALDAIRGRFGRDVIAHGAAAVRDHAPGERRWGS